MPVLDDRHDLAHPVEGDEAWSESYYFNCYDPEADTGFFTRIGVRPNEGTIDVGLSVWEPGGGLAVVRHVQEQRAMVDGVLSVGPVEYSMVEPGKRWRLTAPSLDVTFDALTPMIGVDGRGGSATARTVGKGHLEQAGRWSGWIEAGGQRRVLGAEARGNRDKSWGPRRWGGPTMWRWFSVNVGDDTHFGGIRIGTSADAGDDLHRGWVWTDGAHSSIREWKIASELADDGVTHTATHVLATDKDGRTHELHADVLRVEPGAAGVRANATIVNEGLARWTYAGRTGYGISEYLHQLDGDAKPRIPIE